MAKDNGTPFDLPGDETESVTDSLVEVFSERTELPEAGGVAWTELWGKQDGMPFRINVTARSVDSLSAFLQLIDMVDTAKSFDFFPYPKRDTVDVTQPEKPAPAVTQPEKPAPAVTQPEKPAVTQPKEGENNDETQFVDGDWLIINPKQDDKVGIEVWRVGDKFPRLNYTTYPRFALETYGLLLGLFEDDFRKAQKIEKPIRVFWKYSEKTMSNGNHYKNVIGAETL